MKFSCCFKGSRSNKKKEKKYETGGGAPSYVDDASVTLVDLHNFYRNGLKKFRDNLRFEHLLQRVRNQHIYNRELQRLNLDKLD